jgi:F0F1-type ATP synthase assembly protein I
MGVQLAGTMLFYVFAGYLLDRWLKTEPWLLIAGSVVGMIAFFFQIVRLAKRFPTTAQKKGDQFKASGKNDGSSG